LVQRGHDHVGDIDRRFHADWRLGDNPGAPDPRLGQPLKPIYLLTHQTGLSLDAFA
jgi:hypothetical protein